jgi:hypothetical protein
MLHRNEFCCIKIKRNLQKSRMLAENKNTTDLKYFIHWNDRYAVSSVAASNRLSTLGSVNASTAIIFPSDELNVIRE